jgi:hypothetical protein
VLRLLTIVINFLTLAGAVWLGVYLVTRSPRSLIAWLTGLTLWSLAGLFLNVLLAVYPPPSAVSTSSWLRIILPFWPVTEINEPSAWLQGWSVAPAIAFWHHATTIMRPGRLNTWRWIRVLSAYALAIAAIILQASTPFLFPVGGGDPLYLNTLQAGPLYPVFATGLVIFSAASLINLLRSAHETPFYMPRRQLNTLAAATLVAGLVGPVSIAGSALGYPIPMLAISLPLGIAVGLIGFGVARYSALMEGRTMLRDFLYNALAVGSVMLFYLVVISLLAAAYALPAILTILVVTLAIFTHALISLARTALDTIFFRGRTRELRTSLRNLARLAAEQGELAERLSLAFDSICTSVRATFGVMLDVRGGNIHTLTAYRWRERPLTMPVEGLLADDVVHLDPGQLAPPFEEAALLIPLYAEEDQLGALLLGRPENGVQYSLTDLERLLDPSDRLAIAIRDHQREAAYIEQLASLTKSLQPRERPGSLQVTVKTVENALRNLSDFAYLGDSPLANLRLAGSFLSQGQVTHLDRGKAVYTTITTALEKLKPDGEMKGNPPPREWYPYLILHQAYLEDVPNRDIMSYLYISEGTFSRTRRAAIRAIARALEEMEAAFN